MSMLTPDDLKQHAAKVLGAASEYASNTKSVAHADALKAAMSAANKASAFFEGPDHAPTPTTDLLREKLLRLIEDHAALKKLIATDGDGMTGGTRARRLNEIEAEYEHLSSIIRREEA
jgi:hypothetical protein